MAAKAARARRPTSRMLSTDRRSGFTLIEVVAVMLIIALVASLVVTLMPGTGRAQLRALALEMAAMLRSERQDAILSGHARQVFVDSEGRALVGDGRKSVVIPPDVVLDVLGVNKLWSGHVSVVRFEPDGASTGAVFKLSRQEAEYEVRVNWYSGAVAVIPH